MRNTTKLGVLGDIRKKKVADAIETFKAFAQHRAEIVVLSDTDDIAKFAAGCNYVVVFGGDGTLIRSVRILEGMNIPIIGVNLGKLGFLAEFNLDELDEQFSDIIEERVNLEDRMMFQCVHTRDGKAEDRSVAVNDVFVSAGEPFRVIELEILIDGKVVACCVGDGLIVATPTGSTAYNLSAGGPILSGKIEAAVITPICPHSLSFRPMVVDSDSVIEIIGKSVQKGTQVSIDGQIMWPFAENDRLQISLSSHRFLLVNNPVRTPWQTLATKLGWAQTPTYKQ